MPGKSRRGLSLAEVLVASALGLVIVSAIASMYAGTYRHARAIQRRSDLDVLVHKLFGRLRLDLAASNGPGVLYQAQSPALWIRRFARPDAGGPRWGGLAGYRLEDGVLRRYEAVLAELPADQPFPADPEQLQALWRTPPTTSARSISGLQLRSGANFVEVSLRLESQDYRCRVDFQL